MANGFRPYLLAHLMEIAQSATPQFKVDPQGFLNFLQSQKKPSVLRLNNAAGHQESVQVKYRQRWTKDFVDSSIDCNVTNVPSYLETSVALASTSAFAINIADETIAKYEDEASKTVAVGQPSTDFMNEFVEEIYAGANAILSKLNSDLLTILSANIGVNRRTGVNTASTINLNKNANTNNLTDGITQILADYKLNGFTGTPQAIGGGLFANYMWQQVAKGLDSTGLNSSILAGGMKFYYDLDVATVFGANHLIVAEPDAVQIVEYMKYTGFKAGIKPGGSTFGTMTLPMQVGTEVLGVDFDFQLKYNDCKKSFTDAYYGNSVEIEPGYQLIISKSAGLFTLPTNAYRAGDPLVGNRGTLRYNITNTCDDCGA
jgi:hypothetical protein